MKSDITGQNKPVSTFLSIKTGFKWTLTLLRGSQWKRSCDLTSGAKSLFPVSMGEEDIFLGGVRLFDVYNNLQEKPAGESHRRSIRCRTSHPAGKRPDASSTRVQSDLHAACEGKLWHLICFLVFLSPCSESVNCLTSVCMCASLSSSHPSICAEDEQGSIFSSVWDQAAICTDWN